MRRGAAAAFVAVALATGACSDGGTTVAPPATTVAFTGPLVPALLTQSQLRRVPGFSTLVVVDVASATAFAEPDPRGPCGAPVPQLPLDDAMGTAWSSNTIRGGFQLVVRRPATELQRYMTARLRNTSENCPPFKIRTRSGGEQELKFESAVRITREAAQSFAVVMAVRVGADVRAQTIIEVRTGNLLSRAVLFTSRPVGSSVVRGIAALMAKSQRNVV
ncbi:MAG: hypothetical protein Q8K63_12220 [Acidimicrobiales bacterium]|nr:hypothetical protein [Acidimicrobiales bacterium]